jgi:TolB-like protein/tetratricopeptide (TPR) repeat protein
MAEDSPTSSEGNLETAAEASIDRAASRDVFVSYASQDAAIANAVVLALERGGLTCWIAPRDVTPGALYADGIIRAINEAKVLVLVLSGSSIASPHVGKEVERASSKRRPIITLRTDAAPLTTALEYFLSESQWIDWESEGKESALKKVTNAVRRHVTVGHAIGTSVDARTTVASKSDGSHGTRGQRRRFMAVATVVAALAVAAAYIIVDNFWQPKHVAEDKSLAAAVPKAAADLPAIPVIVEKTVAVLPFIDMSEKKDQEYFADGMSEEIIDLLAKMPGLTVIGRTSSFQFKGKSEDLRTIGTTLGAGYVLEGSVRKAASKIRVTAQLIDTKDGTHSWSDTFDRDFGDVLSLQDEIAAGVARALQVTVDTDISQRQRKLTSATTYTLYLRGRHALDRQDESGFQEAQTDFEQALALDPSYIQAAEQLVKTLAGQVAEGFVPSEIGWQRVRKAADEALRLDANSALVHSFLGLRYALYEFDFKAADTEVAQALKLSPRDPSVLGAAARLAFIHGRFDEALRLVNNSLAVDPLAPLNFELLGDIRYFSGKFPEAEAAIRKTIQISPTSANMHYSLGLVLLAHGLPAAALKEMEIETPDGGRDAGLAIVYHSLGRHAESDSALQRLTQQYGANWAYGVAKAHSFRGERDNAFVWLDRSYSQRNSSLQYVKGDPLLANLRGDPRYTAFLRKMNLTEE